MVDDQQHLPGPEHDQRQGDELHPARNQDLFGSVLGHLGHPAKPRGRVGGHEAGGKSPQSGTLERMITSRTPPRRYARRRVDHRRRNRRLAGLVLVLALVAACRAAPFTAGGRPAAASPRSPHRRPPARRPTGRPSSRAWPPPTTASSSTSRSPRSGSPPSSTTAAATTWSPLTPSGHQHNADLLTRISNMLTGDEQLERPRLLHRLERRRAPRPARSTSARSPARASTPRADGRIVSVQPYVISGKTYGSVIQIQPSTAPTLIVTITNVKRADAIVVGKQVTAAETRWAPSSTSPRCSPRSSPSTPPTRATTSTSRSRARPPRLPSSERPTEAARSSATRSPGPACA